MSTGEPLSQDRRSALGMSVHQGLLLACLFVALALRLYGVSFGLPHLYYWDEPTVVNRAVRFGSGDFNPHFFYYPAFYMYCLFGVSGAYYAAGRVTGMFHSSQDFALQYFTDPSGLYLTVRAFTACIGTAAVAFVYLVGRRYFSARVGLVGAAIFAVLPLHVSHSHVAITDVPHALLVCAALLPLHDVLTRGRARDYVLSGLLIGLGGATKYLALVHLATLTVAHLLREPPRHEARGLPARLVAALASPMLWLGYLATSLGFFFGTPYNVLELSAFVADFRAQMALSAGDAGQGFLLLRNLPADCGWPACGLALFGTVRLLRDGSRKHLVLLTFPALYCVLMLRMTKVFARYLLPQSAFVCLLAAYGLTGLWEWLEAHTSRRQARFAQSGLLVMTLALPLWRSVTWDALVARPDDTRTLALAWFERTVPAGSSVSLQSLYDRTFDNAPLVTDRAIARLERIIPSTGSMGLVRERALARVRERTVYTDVAWSEDPAALTQARYVVLVDVYGEPSVAVRAWLKRHGRVVQTFVGPRPRAFADLPADGAELLPLLPPDLTVYEVLNRNQQPPG